MSGSLDPAAACDGAINFGWYCASQCSAILGCGGMLRWKIFAPKPQIRCGVAVSLFKSRETGNSPANVLTSAEETNRHLRQRVPG